MADAVASQTILSGPRNYVIKFTNTSDGTGETRERKVDVSAFDTPISGVKITRIDYTTSGMGVDILWDATTPVKAISIPQDESGQMDFRPFGGLINNSGAGSTGDILFTTSMQEIGDRYSITLYMVKE